MVIVFALCLRIVLASSFPRCAGFSGAPDARLSNVGLNDLMIIKCFIDDRCSIVCSFVECSFVETAHAVSSLAVARNYFL